MQETRLPGTTEIHLVEEIKRVGEDVRTVAEAAKTITKKSLFKKVFSRHGALEPKDDELWMEISNPDWDETKMPNDNIARIYVNALDNVPAQADMISIEYYCADTGDGMGRSEGIRKPNLKDLEVLKKLVTDTASKAGVSGDSRIKPIFDRWSGVEDLKLEAETNANARME